MNDSQLFMFLGYPGSGKSYFAKRLAEKIRAVRLNGDSMRIALYGSVDGIELVGDKTYVNQQTFGALDYAAEQILIAGQSVVYDAHHNKRSIRANLEELASKHQATAIVIWIKTDHELALKRGQERESTADQRQLSEEKMKESMARHMANFDEPVAGEHVLHIDGSISFEEQYLTFQSQLADILAASA